MLVRKDDDREMAAVIDLQSIYISTCLTAGYEGGSNKKIGKKRIVETVVRTTRARAQSRKRIVLFKCFSRLLTALDRLQVLFRSVSNAVAVVQCLGNSSR